MEAPEIQDRKRVVAIVGRPNVGKSAIFNRIAGNRIAIVHEQSGVTRDRLVREVSWGNERFQLIDTGGVSNVDGSKVQDEIEAGVRKQVDVALADAAVAIFVVDLEKGMQPMDEEVAGLLHKSGTTVFLAANKADNPSRDPAAVEFEKFGYPVFPVSALHNRGFEELMRRVVRLLPEGENESVKDPLKVAVVGRPNVGKSSFVNRLLKSERVIVSAVPGTTRDSIDVPFVIGKGAMARHYLLIDTAGMRPAGKIDSAVERYGHMRSELSVKRSNLSVLIIDAVQGPTAQDKKIADFIATSDKGCMLVVNKWDLAKGVTEDSYEKALRKAMPFVAYCPVVFVSAKRGDNIRMCVDLIDAVSAQVRASLPTGVLNRIILDACDRVQPPAIKGKRLRLYYATQVGVDPVTIKAFVNQEWRVSDSYKEYLIKKIREGFGLEGAPVRIVFEARKRDERLQKLFKHRDTN